MENFKQNAPACLHCKQTIKDRKNSILVPKFTLSSLSFSLIVCADCLHKQNCCILIRIMFSIVYLAVFFVSLIEQIAMVFMA